MKEFYDVYRAEEKVGQVALERQGLYCDLECICQGAGETEAYLVAVSGEERQDLGQCIPQGDTLCLRRYLSSRILRGEQLSFQLSGKEKAKFIPLQEAQPLETVAVLEDAVFAVQDGMPGLQLSDKPTGQWSEPKTSE